MHCRQNERTRFCLRHTFPVDGPFDDVFYRLEGGVLVCWKQVEELLENGSVVELHPPYIHSTANTNNTD